MPQQRLTEEQQLGLAVDDLIALASKVDRLDVVASGPGQVSISSEERSWSARVVARDAMGEPDVRQLVARAGRGANVAVANEISEPARALLSAKGWSWLDRRLGAHIADGERSVDILYVTRPEDQGDRPRPLRTSSPSTDGPIRGRAGISYAAALLCHPGERPSLRSIAAVIGMSPTSVSTAAKHLAEAGLIEPDGSPAYPDLFDALAAVWGPLEARPVAAVPEPDDPRLHAHVDDLTSRGWALGGDLAALELGAPIFTTDERPVQWVPTLVELRRAERHLGSAAWSERAGVLAVPSTPLVNLTRGGVGASGWPLPHPVFAALDLAQDPGRGREVLDQWSPEGFRAVWR